MTAQGELAAAFGAHVDLAVHMEAEEAVAAVMWQFGESGAHGVKVARSAPVRGISAGQVQR